MVGEYRGNPFIRQRMFSRKKMIIFQCVFLANLDFHMLALPKQKQHLYFVLTLWVPAFQMASVSTNHFLFQH